MPLVNDPFVLDSQDRFNASTIAAKAGVATPKTLILPHRDYGPEIVHEESLRNLDYPLDWDAVLETVGVPCILRDAQVGGGAESHLCHSVEELLHHYNQSSRHLMIAQERIEWEHFVRCLVLGPGEALPLKYDPEAAKYEVDHEHLSAHQGEAIVEDSLKLTRLFGYDLNAIDWGIRDGVAYAVDLLNPIPDFDVYTLTSHYFERVVEKVADMAIRLALEPHGMGAGEGTAPRSQAAPGDLTGGAGEQAKGPRDGAGDLAEELPSLARGLPPTEL